MGNTYNHSGVGANEDGEGEQDDSELVNRAVDYGLQGGDEEIMWRKKYRDLLEIVQIRLLNELYVVGIYKAGNLQVPGTLYIFLYCYSRVPHPAATSDRPIPRPPERQQ